MSVAGKTVSSYPILLKEWDLKKNAGIYPNFMTAGSNRKVWWKCEKGHPFFKSPNGRTNNQRATGGVSGCPGCASERRWTWGKIVFAAKGIAEKEGALPPAGRIQASGHAMLVQSVYKLGKTWEHLRDAVESFETSSFVESRSGIRWRSHPEASLSNFLFARGIQHQRGRKYPEDYGKFSGKRYGYFDIYFIDRRGRPIDIEIWGDKPYGQNEQIYSKVRKNKERFNADRKGFLGIHFKECYDDNKLTKILRPYIGVIAPHVFLKEHDPFLETSHWSNADVLIESCKNIAGMQPNGKFPSEDWLRKRGRWRNRKGPAYNTISIYIKTWIGGTRKVRELLGQSQFSTRKWNRESALKELKLWFDRYGKSPSSIRADAQRGKLNIGRDELKFAANLDAAVRKHFGTIVDACIEVGVIPSRRYPKEVPSLKRNRK